MKKFLMSVLFFMFFISMFGKIIYYGNIEPNGYTIENYSNINELRESLSSIENDIKDEYETTEEYNTRVTQKVVKLNTKEFLINCKVNYLYNSDAQEYNFTLDFDNCKEFLPPMFLKNEIQIPCPLEKAKKYRNNKIQAAIVISDISTNTKNISQEISSKIKRIIFYSETNKEELFSINNFKITLEDIPTYITQNLNGYLTAEGLTLFDKNGNAKDFSNKKSLYIPHLYKCFDEYTGKYHIENIAGEFIGDNKLCYFDEIEELPISQSFSKEILLIKNNGKSGIINTDGKILLDTIYDAIYDHYTIIGMLTYHNQEYIITKDGKQGIMDKKGEILLSCNYNILIDEDTSEDESDKISEEYIKIANKNTQSDWEGISPPYCIKEGDKYGFFDINKKQLFFPEKFSENIAYSGNKDCMLIGVADLKETSDGLYINLKKSKFRIVKKSGETIINIGEMKVPQSNQITGVIFYEEIFQCILNKKNMIYNNDGKVLFSNAEVIEEYDENLIIKQNNKYGVINKYGEIVKPINYLNIEKCKNTFTNNINSNTEISYNIFDKNGKYGIIDSNNKEVVIAKFDSINMENDAFIVVKNGKSGIINKKTWEPIYYDTIKPSILNLFFITIDNSMGVIDCNGEYMLKLSNFYEYRIFTKNCIFVKDSIGYWHSVDKNGKNKSNTNYLEIINKILNEDSDYETDCSNFYIVKGNNNKYGIVNSDGVEVLECIADKIELRSGITLRGIPYIKITKEDKVAYLNYDGSTLGDVADNSKSYFSKSYTLPEVDGTSDVPVTIIYAYYPSINKIKVGLKRDNEILAAPKFDKLELSGEVATLSIDNFSVCVDCNETPKTYEAVAQ